MKTLALAAALAIVPGVVSAGTLVAGAVRDGDGYAVAGAQLAVTAADGRVTARGTTAADGTFAIDSAGVPAALDVTCSFCVPQRVALTGDPAAVFVVRYAALRDRLPSTDDIAALPYGRAADAAALVPYTIVSPRGISDRGLGEGQGAALIDGISFYRPTDGINALYLVPLHSTASIGADSAGFAQVYGGYGAGGTFDVGTLGDVSAEGRSGGDGQSGVLRTSGANGAATLGESTAFTAVRRATARLFEPVGGGTLALTATAAGTSAADEAGVALTYATGLSRVDLAGSLTGSTSRTAAAYGTVTSAADVRTDVHVRGRGPAAVEFGLRAQQSSGADGPSAVAGTQSEAALYADARSTGNGATLLASVALQRDVQSLGAPRTWASNAVLPALSVEHPLGAGFSLRASTTATLRENYLLQIAPAAVPAAAPFVHANLVDAALSFSDGHRLRADVVAYTQQSGDAGGRIAGFGLNAAWQITPQLALRSWALAAFANADEDAPPAYPYAYPETATTLRRQVAWLTYRHNVRVDLLTTGSGIDGSLGIPFGRTATLLAGSYGAPYGRVVTLGVRFR